MTRTTANSKQQTAKGDRTAAAPVAAADPFAGAYTFRKLIVSQRAQELTNEVLDLITQLPTDRLTAILCQQILRSSSSIAANIAEGHGRYAAGSYRNHLSIARGSTAETISWLDLLRRRRLITGEQEASALGKCAEIMKMVTAKMIDLDKQTRTDRTFRDEREDYRAD
jgi:four helix bundle protein